MDEPVRRLDGDRSTAGDAFPAPATEAVAEFAYTVDENGLPRSISVLSATDKAWAEMNAQAIARMRFSAPMRNGKPVAIVRAQTFRRPAPEGPRPAAKGPKPLPEEELLGLDEPVRRTVHDTPRLTKRLLSLSGIEAQLVYTVDENGVPTAISAVSATDREWATVCAASLAEARFSKPMRNGRSVAIVRTIFYRLEVKP